MPSEQQLLTAKEAAALLGLSEHTILQWIWQRRLPVIRLGPAVRLKRQDLDQLIDQSREEAMTWKSRV
jgi:excisionase family DNA binding protein